MYGGRVDQQSREHYDHRCHQIANSYRRRSSLEEALLSAAVSLCAHVEPWMGPHRGGNGVGALARQVLHMGGGGNGGRSQGIFLQRSTLGQELRGGGRNWVLSMRQRNGRKPKADERAPSNAPTACVTSAPVTARADPCAFASSRSGWSSPTTSPPSDASPEGRWVLFVGVEERGRRDLRVVFYAHSSFSLSRLWTARSCRSSRLHSRSYSKSLASLSLSPSSSTSSLSSPPSPLASSPSLSHSEPSLTSLFLSIPPHPYSILSHPPSSPLRSPVSHPTPPVVALFHRHRDQPSPLLSLLSLFSSLPLSLLLLSPLSSHTLSPLDPSTIHSSSPSPQLHLYPPLVIHSLPPPLFISRPLSSPLHPSSFISLLLLLSLFLILLQSSNSPLSSSLPPLPLSSHSTHPPASSLLPPPSRPSSYSPSFSLIHLYVSLRFR
ncbi:hypothetical protein C7M84_004948 [Penaeus vannamei]|uniref:Uncharacterized protein n=1 Tax=Penaeus vannamei TaxID=6689 RepID=A0A3R7MH74_PENVA|nr:hypothetical protein C7M84_004948 [Penaeus vannamei]